MQHMNKTISPPTKPPRVSVPVDAETLAVFQRLGKAGNLSTGGAIAEWLRDTVEAAEFMAQKMEQARAAPKVVMREMHAYALGLADETGALMRQIAEKGAADRAASGKRSAPTPNAATAPPSCNTGGKLTKAKKTTTVSKSGFPLSKVPRTASVQAYADTNGIPPKAPK